MFPICLVGWGQNGFEACERRVKGLAFSNMSTYLKSERLIFREWKDEDRAPFARMNADPLVMEYLPRSLNEKESNHLVDKFQKHLDDHGYGLYAVEVEDTGQFAGFIGLNTVPFKAHFTSPKNPATEIAWRLDYAMWGQGYGSEGAQAVLNHGLKKLGLDEVVAFTVHDNTRTMYLMEKIGMKRDEDGGFHYPTLPDGHPLGDFVLYRS